MEAEFVTWLSQRIKQDPRVPLGVGDDAAIVLAECREIVTASDLLCDGVHFVVGQTAWELIGRKSLAVNLSDFAAMAAVPQFAVVSLLWPRQLPWQDACRLYEGLLDLADEHDVALVGGDTNRWSGQLAINVTLIGVARAGGVWKRSTAQPGDAIVVTGPLGGSLSGHHLTFQPRVKESRAIDAEFSIHAGMDITDGLTLDLNRMAQASQVGAELDLDAIPISEAAHAAAAKNERSPLAHALSDGEDFELLLTMEDGVARALLESDSFPTLQLTKVGTIIQQPGLYRKTALGRQPLSAMGYLH